MRFPDHMIENMMVVILANSDNWDVRIPARKTFESMGVHVPAWRVPVGWVDIRMTRDLGPPIFSLFVDLLPQVVDRDAKSC